MSTGNTLSPGLAAALLQEIFHKELSLYEDQVLHLGDPKTRQLRCFLFDNGYLDKGELKHFINKQLLAYGKRMYRLHADSMQDGRLLVYPDHLPSPHALGYAIKCGTVLPISIRFDHGETAKDYMKKAERLLEKVIEQLLTPYDPKSATVPINLGVAACCSG